MSLSVPFPAYRAAYRAKQTAVRLPLVAAHAALRRAAGRSRRASPADLAALRERYAELLERDLANAREGVYPVSLLFEAPLAEYARNLPRLLADLPRVFRRFRRGDYRELPQDVDVDAYPAYFRRNFHWQSDGYLSRRSAQLYDLGVEFMFLGCADVMRRQVIPPLARYAREAARRPLRVLDVGCGTGRALTQIGAALPGQRYFGVDLSPFYLEIARERLARLPGAALVAENAEQLPFRDGYFDVVTSIFLFHELPRQARRRVAAEMARVLRPGGLLVLEDSAQLREAGDLAAFLEGFASEMHEPFYRDYVRDDLEEIVSEAGLEIDSTQRCWLAKVVTARRPARRRS